MSALRGVVSHTLCMLVISVLVSSGTSASAAGRHFTDWRAMRDAQLVRQSRDYTCGLAALATLLVHALERNVGEATLVTQLKRGMQGGSIDTERWEESGVSFRTLQRLAQLHGLEAAGLSLDLPGVMQLTVPAIAYLEYFGQPHFTVIRSVDAKHGEVQLADPGWGNWRLTREQFRRLWDPEGAGQGRILLLVPPGAGDLSLLRRYFESGGAGNGRARPIMPPREVFTQARFPAG